MKFDQPIQKLYWEDVREYVAKVEPEFAKLVDKISPDKSFPLYLVRYPYGATIVDRGKCYYPLPNGQMAPLTDPRLPEEMRKDLSKVGTLFPAGIILENSIELYINPDQRVFPWMLYRAGTIFALWSRLEDEPIYHPTHIFSISAGARSIFMLPHISDYGLHKNLQREFNLRLPPPKDLLDQWHIFKALAKRAECQWKTMLLYFSDRWLQKLHDCDPAWVNLHRKLLDYAWKKSGYWRNQQFYNCAFTWVQEKRNLKPNPYLADTVKYLVAIAAGAISGFSAATDNSDAPVDLIQKIYLENYKLKHYVPTLMRPSFLSPHNSNSHVYYSLQLPSALEFSPKSRKLSTTLHDLKELKHITEVFFDEIKKGSILIDGTSIAKAVNTVGMSYFHSKPDYYGEISLTKNMPKDDPSLMYCLDPQKRDQFAETGTFLRGCIRISAKKVQKK